MVDRKRDHIELALHSQANSLQQDTRFNYEPLLSGHRSIPDLSVTFLGKKLKYPIWISSMTGGTARGKIINRHLAQLAKNFGLGMGLGSLRPLLSGNQFFKDFDIRDDIGNDLPLYGNLGIAQLEELLTNNNLGILNDLVGRLRLDGLFIHLNPLQEFLQPEGDRFKSSPLQILEQSLAQLSFPVLVKEVGSGMGPLSMNSLAALPIAGIELGAWEGTNFAQLELMRQSGRNAEVFKGLTNIGHCAIEMINTANNFSRPMPLILSGGVKNFLDGFYLREKCHQPCVYGMASRLLPFVEDFAVLTEYMQAEIEGLIFAHQFLRVKES